MIEPPVQGVALADLGRVIAYRNLGAQGGCNAGCIVIAVIRDNEQSIAGTELALEVGKGWLKTDQFIVRRYQHRNPAATTRLGLKDGFSFAQES